ncbi:MAG: DinB family protein [Gemmatimonadota bacterium]
MRRFPCLFAVVALGVSCTPAADSEAVESATTAIAGSPEHLQLTNLERTVEIVHEKMRDLAEAMPEEDLAWRPMEGVRSVEEVFIHVAADNWYVPALLGWDAPAETGVTNDVETFRAYQSQEMSREEMLEVLDASFVFFRETMAASGSELDREVVLGSPTTVGDVWIRAVVHLHEHLGQGIAYARANEVVPPWSR